MLWWPLDHDCGDSFAHRVNNSDSTPAAHDASSGSLAGILRLPPHWKKTSANVFFARMTYPSPHCG